MRVDCLLVALGHLFLLNGTLGQSDQQPTTQPPLIPSTTQPPPSIPTTTTTTTIFQSTRQPVPSSTLKLQTESVILLPVSNGIQPTPTNSPTPEPPFFTSLLTLIAVGGSGVLLICVTFGCACCILGCRRKKRSRKFTMKMVRRTPDVEKPFKMNSLHPHDKDPLQQRAHAQPSNSTHNNRETSQTVLVTNDYNTMTAGTKNPSYSSHLPNSFMQTTNIAIDEIEEIYDSNPLSPISDDEENIYDNDTPDGELLETAIAYTNTDRDEYDDENIYDNDAPDGETVIENANTDGVTYEDEDIYDNETPNDGYSKASEIRPRTKTHLESVKQWVPQIGKDTRRRSEGIQYNRNYSPPLEDDDGYVDVVPPLQSPPLKSPLVEDENIYDNDF